MRRVENHKPVGVPIGSYINGRLVIRHVTCESAESCKTRYSNFYVCSGLRGVVSGSKNSECGFRRANDPANTITSRWTLKP